MKGLKTGVVFFATAAAVLAWADAPASHSGYPGARTGLRMAQFLLRMDDRPNVTRHVREMDGEIERAIREIDNAGVLDRKYLENRPLIDRGLDLRSRFRKSLDLLAKARHDLKEGADNSPGIGWQDAAIRHIDLAIEQLRRAARDLGIDRLEGY